MKLKNLLFGSTAGLMVVTGAQAADLPAAEPVEYVRVCDAFGTGFFYIPGTDTCLKIDGYARYEMHWVSDSDIYEYNPGAGPYVDNDGDIQRDDFDHEESFNNFTTRARGEVRFDARTMTDLGLLRSYVALRGTIGPTNTGSYSDGFNIDKAWLSLANDTGTLTAGHHGSFYDFFGGLAMNTRIGGDDPTVSTNLLAYTFGVGNGLSASISVEDKWFRRYGIGAGVTTSMPATDSTNTFLSNITSDNTTPSLTAFDNDGQEMPDFVANIRVDQGWGSAQIMGAIGRVGAVNSGSLESFDGDEVSAHDDDIGWVVGAGLSLGIPGTGFSLDVQADWGEGLIAYGTTGNGAIIADAVYTESGGLDLTEFWDIKAGIGADLSSTVGVSLDGAYASVDHGGTLGGEDYNTWIVAGTVHWRPVSGLTISGELAYENIDADSSAHYVVDDDVWGAMMRINRTF